MFDMLLRKTALKENKVKTMSVWYKIYQNDCLEWLREVSDTEIHLTFVDPPFNQGKEYKYFNDAQPQEQYWNWLKEILSQIYRITVRGGAIYFMQREKNTEQVLRILRETGWTFQNLIIWKKKHPPSPAILDFLNNIRSLPLLQREKNQGFSINYGLTYPSHQSTNMRELMGYISLMYGMILEN
jgi:DNA modification methylase